MKSVPRIKLYGIVAVCLLLFFGYGCSGKTQPSPDTGASAAGALSETPEKPEKPEPDAKKKHAEGPENQNTEIQKAVAAASKDSDEAAEEEGKASGLTDAAAEKGSSRSNGEQEKESVQPQKGEPEDRGEEAEQENQTDAPEGEEEPEAEASEKIVLNFDSADLVEVIKTIAELLDINYLLDTDVSGSVTIHTSGELDQADLFPVFYQILEVNGLTAVKKGSLYRIVPIKDAGRLPIAAELGDGRSTDAAGGQMMIQLVQLDSIAASEITKVLEPFVSSNGTMITLENANVLMIVDQAENMDKILRMVDTFDTDIFDEVSYRFFPLDHADAESLSKIMDQMLKSYGQTIEGRTNLIPITRLNALLVISPRQKVLDEVDRFVKQYDVPSTSTESGIFVYSVQNGRADEITGILKEVFTGRTSKEERARQQTYRNPLAREAQAEKQEAEADSASSEKESDGDDSSASASDSGGADVTIGSGSLHGEVKITADEVRNNLIVEATPADYQVIKNLLKEIDELPRQVLIEVTIAEVTLDKSTELGVEWSYLKGEENLSTSLLEADLGDSGLRYTIGKADRWTATMKALASKNMVNILSSPSIVASNSESAQIDISTEIPVASSQYEYTSGENPVVSTDIEYRDTGVMLNVTPHINKNGIVSMEIAQEVSEQAQSVQVGNLNYPSFFKRSADTILTVASGQAIVIGGLIRENRSDGSSGAPWFINLPLIKYLFGRTSESYEKTELVILISPHVITSLDDVDAVTHEFRNKMGSLFKEKNNEAVLRKN
ncbi:MAG: type II secretion system secretin GspD [Desulfobacterales bacterium]